MTTKVHSASRVCRGLALGLAATLPGCALLVGLDDVVEDSTDSTTGQGGQAGFPGDSAGEAGTPGSGRSEGGQPPSSSGGTRNVGDAGQESSGGSTGMGPAGSSSSGACSDACTVGDQRCANESEQVCRQASGCAQWEVVEECDFGCDGDRCEACEPDCGSKECGSDGCNGSCGSCASDESCESGQCVFDRYCGDGTCNGSETQSSCCDDCGCSGDDVCEDNDCVPPCDEVTVRLRNSAPNEAVTSPVCGDVTTYSGLFVLAVGDDESGLFWFNSGQYLDVPVEYGSRVGVSWQCCYVDPLLYPYSCGLYSGTCTYPDGTSGYCACSATQSEIFEADSCGTQSYSLCL